MSGAALLRRARHQAEPAPVIIPGCENAWNMQRRGCCSRRLARCRARLQDLWARARPRCCCGCGRDCGARRWRICGWHFPEWSKKQRRAAIRGMVRQLGWMGAEFAHFPRYTKENIDRIVLLDGFENFASAQARGKGSPVSHRPHERVGTRSFCPGAVSAIRCIFWRARLTIRAWMRW